MHGIETAELADAKKNTLSDKEALALAKRVDHLYATKGKQVVHIDVKRDRPDRATLLALMLGPTGNLRAPTIRVGRTLLVGFDSAMYKSILDPE